MTPLKAMLTMKTLGESKITPPMAPKDNGMRNDSAMCNAGLPH